MADGTQALGEARARYEEDEYGWLIEQAGLLREGRVDEIDRASLVEFLTDMAGNKRDAFRSAMAVLLHHMLKVLAQPERMPRSRALTIVEQQQQAQFIMEDEPGMQQHLPGLYAKAYSAARRRAAAETGIVLSRFPADNPWTMDDALAYAPPEPLPRGRRA